MKSISPASAARRRSFAESRAALDLSIIGCISSTTNYILLGNKQTRTVEDLKGKTIGITGAGTYSEFAVKAFLKKNNLDPNKDVVLRAIGGTVLRAAAIEKGIIAAAPFSTDDAVRLIRADIRDQQHERIAWNSAKHHRHPKRGPGKISRNQQAASQGVYSGHPAGQVQQKRSDQSGL